jgi:hypothetical protein
LVFTFLPLQFVVHSPDLVVVAFKLSEDHLFEITFLEFFLDDLEVLLDLRQFVSICLAALCLFIEKIGFISKLLNTLLKVIKHRLQVALAYLVCVQDVVTAMFTDGASETDPAGAVLTIPSYLLITMLAASVEHYTVGKGRATTSCQSRLWRTLCH